MYNKLLCIAFLLLSTGLIQAQQPFPRWEKGFFDIHHISTGRGNATFMILPDGTTLLIDAGELSDTHPRTLSARNSAQKPNDTKPAHKWIADYIRKFSPDSQQANLDYAVITHFHDDHFGEWDSLRKPSASGKYMLTGITGVAEYIPVKKLIDRGHRFPFSTLPNNSLSQTLHNYFNFINYQQQKGMIYDTLVPGASDQIILTKNQREFPNWNCFNIAAGGYVATGFTSRDSYHALPDQHYPGENPLSICLKFSYGKFDYFTGGDISGIGEYGEDDIRSMEAHVAPVIGPVDVATLNHHGNRDSQHAFYIRTIRPRIWIQQTWSSDHPGHDVLRRIMSTSLYPGKRELFATDFLRANEDVIGSPYVQKAYSALSGHIVIRVQPGGNQYSVIVLDDTKTNPDIRSVHGPYQSR